MTGLRAGHPRIMMIAGDWERLRTLRAGNDSLAGLLLYCHKRADSILNVPPRTYNRVGGDILEVSRSVLDRVTLLSFLAVYDTDSRYAARALRELDSAAQFPDWCPSTFLDVAEMSAAFAIGYDWLYSAMSPDQRSRYRAALRNKAFVPALAGYNAGAFWVDSKSNWNIVCNSGLALAAMAVADEDTLAKKVLERAVGSMLSSASLSAYSQDGAYAEGIMYWGYASQYLTMLLAALQSSFGDTFGLAESPGLSETGLFPLYSEGPTGRTANFGDASDSRPYPYWMGKLAQIYRKPVYAWYAQTHTGFHVLDFIWYDGQRQTPKQAGLPTSRQFRGPDIAVFRSPWQDSLAAWIGFKAGNAQNLHSHLDAGSFVFEALGKRWAMLPGSDSYGLPGYFLDYDDSVTRYTYYRVRAEGHNTLVINAGAGPDQEFNGKSALLVFNPQSQTAVADLSPAYAGRATRVMRGVALKNGNSAWIQDEIALPAAGTIEWRMHTEAAVAVAADGKSAMLTLGNRKVWAALASPSGAGARFESVRAEPGSLSPHPAGQSGNTGLTVLRVRLAGVDKATIVVWLLPLESGALPPTSLPPIEPLDSQAWTTGALLASGPRAQPALITIRTATGLHISVPGSGPFHLEGFSVRGDRFLSYQGIGPAIYDPDPRGPFPVGPGLLRLRQPNQRDAVQSVLLP
ncbi:MAG: heparinase II/III family protein [Fibrobacteria bacterium]